jgi:trimethylamine--corrinoid protein Co-methyltransferase
MKKLHDTTNTIKRSHFPRISTEKCQKIHEASLEILERVGARLFLDEAIDLLKKAGANVSDGNLVRIKPDLAEKALTTVPKTIVLYDRLGNPAISLDGDRCYYGPGSDCLNIIDHRTGQRRKPVLKDLKEGVSLCDALLNIDFLMSMILPTDVEGAIADRYQMEAMLTYSSKPIIFVSYGIEGCKDAVEMAEAVAGGDQALMEKPQIACYINAVSGLRHNKEALEKLVFLAEKNQPFLYIPASTAALSSPVTPAGAVALDNAGVLLGLVLSQLVREGAPVIIPGMPQGTFDMRTLVTSYCEPERILPQAMAHFYGLPMFAIGGASEAKLEDMQASAEAAMSLVVETLTGSDIIHDLGYLESGLTFSFIQLALCNEIVSWIKAYTNEIEVSEETLAVDVIAEIGPDSEFLKTDHTLRHYKERWYPAIFERATYEAWSEKGGKSFSERAQEKIDEFLAQHKPEHLPTQAKKEMKRIVSRAANRDSGEL